MKTLMMAAMLALVPLGAAPAMAQGDALEWQEMVSRTGAGGYLYGNPDAPVKLVEFVSLTCDHCARFAAVANDSLFADYVASGRVSFEIRNFVRDPADVAGAIMTRCGALTRFKPISEALLDRQGEWMGRLQGMSNEELNALFQAQSFEGVAQAAGMAAIGAEHGLGDAERQACMADRSQVDALLALRTNAVEVHAVQGTPSFLINDRLVTAHDWASLRPMIDAALAQ